MAKFVLTAQLQLQAPNNIRQVVNQIQQQLAGISVNVSVNNASQATQSINQITRSANAASTAAGKMGSAFGVSLKRFAAFSLASRAIGLFTNKLSSAIDDAIDFQNEMVKLSQITGESVNKLSSLSNQVTSLATTFGVASKEIVSVTNILAQAGLKSKDLETAINALTKTKLAPTFGDIADTAEGAVAILAQFGEGTGALERQLGAINKVAAEFAVESKDLIDVIRRTGGVFKASGGDLEELIALFTSVRATTRESAESISTGLRTIFTRIQRPETIDYLKQFGVELTDLEGKFVGPYEAIKRLSQALSGLGEGDIRFIQIAEELGGFRQIGKVIPLLQQFTVAEKARQTALASGNSLNEDAAKAQESLLVKFTKVREEFLALIRSISDTTSFKLMVNTLLNLASALIKVADSLKPIIPLLTAFAAVKLTQSIGNFAAGLGAGLGRKNQGGKIHAFASGGLVPGSGNRDTVPAVLTPGEFVIRKSSVKKLGADRLAAMNENRYAGGGIVINPGAIGGFFLRPEKKGEESYKVDKTAEITGITALNKLGYTQTTGKQENKELDLKAQAFSNLTQEQQRAIAVGKAPKKNASAEIKSAYETRLKEWREAAGTAKVGYDRLKNGKSDAAKFLEKKDAKARFNQYLRGEGVEGEKKSNKKEITLNAQKVPIEGSITGFFPGGSPGEKSGDVKREIDNQAKNALKGGILSGVPKVVKLLDNSVIKLAGTSGKSAADKMAKDGNAIRSIGGFIWEGVIEGITKAGVKGGVNSFDFPNLTSDTVNKKYLQAMFGTDSGDARIEQLVKADAKGTAGKNSYGSIVNKLINDINAGKLEGITVTPRTGTKGISSSIMPGVSKKSTNRAVGGGISGSDTVPALLTPGEFVINKQAASKIGYGNLHRMNKQGVTGFATGGLVGIQKFATGTGPGGAKPSNSGGGMGGISTAFILLSGTISSLIPTVKETDSAFKKVSAVVMNGVVQLGTLFALVKTISSSGGLSNIGASVSESIKKSVLKSSVAASEDSSLFGKFKARQMQKAGIYAPAQIRNKQVPEYQAMGSSVIASSNNPGGFAGKVPVLTAGFDKLADGVGRATGAIVSIGASVMIAKSAFDIVAGAMNEFWDYSGKKQKAIERGDVSTAGKMAAEEQKQKAVDKLATPVIGAGAAIGFALGGPAGAAVGAGLGALAVAIGKCVPEVQDFAQSLSESFGGESLKFIEGMAQADAMQANLNKDLAINTHKATKALDDYSRGLISGKDLLSASGKGKAATAMEIANFQVPQYRTGKAEEEFQRVSKEAEMQRARKAQNSSGRGSNLTQVADYWKEFFGYDMETAQSAMGQKLAELQAEQSKVISEQYQGLRSKGIFRAYNEDVFRSSGISGELSETEATQVFDDMIKHLKEVNPKLAEMITAGGNSVKKIAIDDITAQSRAYGENLKYLQALNLGITPVISNLQAAASSLDTFTKSTETGYNSVDSALKNFTNALSPAAKNMSRQDTETTKTNIARALRAGGATEEQVKQTQGTFSAVNLTQRLGEDLLKKTAESIRNKPGTGGRVAPKALAEEFAKQAYEALKGQVPEGEATRIKNLISGSNLDTEEGRALIEQGNFGNILQKVLDPLKKELDASVGDAFKSWQAAQEKLITLTRSRIELEQRLNDSIKKSIDIQLEARKNIEEFGGPLVTARDKIEAYNAQLNVDLRSAGMPGVSGGTPGEILFAQRQVTARYGEFQGRQNLQVARGGGGAFAGPEGLTEDKRKQLEQSQQALLEYSRKRIELIKNEIALAEKKNELEKSAIEKLLGGDIEGYLQEQQAASAAKLLQTGDTQLVNMLGAGAAGAGLLELRKQQEAGAISREELSNAAQVGGAGIINARQAQVFAGTTPELQALREEGKQFATVLQDAGQQLTNLDRMNVQAKTVEIQAAEVMAGGLKNQAVVSNTTALAEPKSKGGIIYANQGRFIPRGTDTIPAMLTPGEFVVNKNAVNTGNNLSVLQSMNSNPQGFAFGGQVKYLAAGGDPWEGIRNNRMAKGAGFANFTQMQLFQQMMMMQMMGGMMGGGGGGGGIFAGMGPLMAMGMMAGPGGLGGGPGGKLIQGILDNFKKNFGGMNMMELMMENMRSQSPLAFFMQGWEGPQKPKARGGFAPFGGGGFAKGGIVSYFDDGGSIFKPKGTDTIPAMLTPGEFVVRREAVNRGNNLQVLQTMNSGGNLATGMSIGGKVQYLANGSRNPLRNLFGGAQANIPTIQLDNTSISSLESAFKDFGDSVEKLKNFKLAIRLDPTNISVRFENTSFLEGLKKDTRQIVLDEVQRAISNVKIDDNGTLRIDPNSTLSK